MDTPNQNPTWLGPGSERISDIVNDDNFVRIEGLGLPSLYLKMEGFNAAGSIKLKAATGMIAALEKSGSIREDTKIIESSSGNLGVALSVVCAERGYSFECVVDPNASEQNLKIMRALGAKITKVVERDGNGGYLGTRISYIKRLIEQDARYLWLNQYANPANPAAHAERTAAAIANAFPEGPSHIFVGAGTTGTLMGCIQYFSRARPSTRIIAVDTVGSVTFGHQPCRRHIPGLGTSRVPEIFDHSAVQETVMVEEVEAIRMCRHLARSKGILVGGSTGTVMAAVLAKKEEIPPDAIVVAIAPDMGERYLDTVFDDDWVAARFGIL